jgi:8-oxo-dGTP pyrophosphatase MutT (NUDIX family)/phosphohistidine phosphatase SixA
MILAAGGVVWRENKDSKIELALIHRPRYDDWSFPKGKLDTGEELISCAYREIMEETGLDIELGPFLGDVEYESIDGPKHVTYWAAKSLNNEAVFHANNEADSLEWHEIDSARSKLTRDSDREILEKFITSPYQANKLIMLRHAKALARSEWQGGDEDRPLDNLGQIQAKRMHAIYQVFNISEVHTSDAVRCYDTVIGMTKARGIEPIITSKLSEYTFEKNKDKSLEYAKELADQVRSNEGAILLCSHNPILPRMLEKVCKKSEVELPENKLKPGDAWVIYLGKKKCLQIDAITAPTV